MTQAERIRHQNDEIIKKSQQELQKMLEQRNRRQEDEHHHYNVQEFATNGKMPLKSSLKKSRSRERYEPNHYATQDGPRHRSGSYSFAHSKPEEGERIMQRREQIE